MLRPVEYFFIPAHCAAALAPIITASPVMERTNQRMSFREWTNKKAAFGEEEQKDGKDQSEGEY